MTKKNLNVFTAAASAAPNGGDDIVASVRFNDGSVMLMLADGATGIGFGRLAAQEFVTTCVERLSAFPEADSAVQFLFLEADRRIRRLQRECDTTGVVCIVRDEEYACASVGDSGAWLIEPHQVTSITRGQPRKPRVGSCCDVPFVKRGRVAGQILMASDGLDHSMMTLDQAAEIVLNASTDPAAELIKAVTTLHERTGGLPDDLAVIVGKPDRNLIESTV